MNELLKRDKEAVRSLGESIGYGNMMSLAEECWRERLEPKGLAGGEFAVGPCVTFMVPCPHTRNTKAKQKMKGWLDKNGHCDWCCGTGRVAKSVALVMHKLPLRLTK